MALTFKKVLTKQETHCWKAPNALSKIFYYMEELKVAVKKAETNQTNLLEVLFSGWTNQLQVLEELENKSLQVIESQKEWFDASKEQINQYEKTTKELTADWKANVQEMFVKTAKVKGSLDWTEKLEEVGNKAQTLAFTPGKASIEILSKSHEQFEKTYKSALEQQQKSRVEITNAMKSILDQVQQAQMSILKSFELPIN